MSKTTKLWAQAVAASRPPSPQIEKKKAEPPIRVLIPRNLNGSGLVVLLDSLKSQIKTKHMERRCRLVIDDKEIRVEWSD